MEVKGLWGAAGLILFGVIVADVLAHPTGVNAAGGQLDSILKTTYAGMLGSVA